MPTKALVLAAVLGGLVISAAMATAIALTVVRMFGTPN